MVFRIRFKSLTIIAQYSFVIAQLVFVLIDAQNRNYFENHVIIKWKFYFKFAILEGPHRKRQLFP